MAQAALGLLISPAAEEGVCMYICMYIYLSPLPLFYLIFSFFSFPFFLSLSLSLSLSIISAGISLVVVVLVRGSAVVSSHGNPELRAIHYSLPFVPFPVFFTPPQSNN